MCFKQNIYISASRVIAPPLKNKVAERSSAPVKPSRLKEIIAEEMNHLSETGDLNMITEAEKKAFEIILEKLTPKQLEEMGLKRV